MLGLQSVTALDPAESLIPRFLTLPDLQGWSKVDLSGMNRVQKYLGRSTGLARQSPRVQR